MNSKRFSIRLTAIQFLILASGCYQSSGLERIAVTGQVATASGKQLNGSVSFIPQAGTKGPAATASIVSGKYRFDRSNGPVSGSYQVVVTPQAEIPSAGTKTTDPKGRTSKGATDKPVTAQKFRADVSSSQNKFDFKLN